MTTTLQDKINNILRDTMSEHWQAVMINKAIQELREEIIKISYQDNLLKTKCLMLEEVQSLIGENKA